MRDLKEMPIRAAGLELWKERAVFVLPAPPASMRPASSAESRLPCCGHRGSAPLGLVETKTQLGVSKEGTRTDTVLKLLSTDYGGRRE